MDSNRKCKYQEYLSKSNLMTSNENISKPDLAFNYFPNEIQNSNYIQKTVLPDLLKCPSFAALHLAH